jgi:hypothetical protein
MRLTVTCVSLLGLGMVATELIALIRAEGRVFLVINSLRMEVGFKTTQSPG